MNMNSPTDNDDHRNGVVGAIDDADATALDADEVTGSEHEDSEDDDDEGTRMKTPVAKRANDDPPLTLKSKYRQFEYLRVRQGDDGKNGRMLCKGCITSCKEDFWIRPLIQGTKRIAHATVLRNKCRRTTLHVFLN